MRDRIIALFIVTGIAITTGFGLHVANNPSQSYARFNIKDLPEHGLSIISPSDPSYEDMVSTLLKDGQNPIVESLQPFSIFIKNTSNRTMVGCMLKWELMRPDGKVLIEKRDYIALWSLMGTDITKTSEAVIRPNATQFFTPSFLEVDQNVNTGGGDDSTTVTPEIAEYLKERSSELAQFINITVSIDGAFFDDGTFVGPDTTGFFARVEAMQNAKRDLMREIEQRVQQGISNDEVFRYIEGITNNPKVEINSTSPATDFYNSFKRESALELLRGKATLGENGGIERALAKLHKAWPALRKK